MFDQPPRFSLDDRASFGLEVASYLIVCHTPDEDGNPTDIFAGSATAMPREAQPDFWGLSRRLLGNHEHERIIQLGYDVICEMRHSSSHDLARNIFHCHEKMDYPGTKHFYVSTMRYPI